MMMMVMMVMMTVTSNSKFSRASMCVFATAMCSLHLVDVACDDVREDSDVGDETVRDTDSQ